MDRLSNRVKIFIFFTSVTAIGVGFSAILLDSTFDWELALGFGLLYFLVEQFPITSSESSTYSISVSFVVTIAATIAAGPGEAAIANAFGPLTVRDLRRTHPLKLAFNAAQIVTTAGVGGIVYHVAGGPIGRASDIFPQVLLALILCTGANFIVNTSLVSTAIALAESRSVWSVWKEQYGSLPAGYFAFAWLGLLLAILYLQIGWGSVVFLLVPLLVARNAFQAAVKMQGAYDATVRAIMRALEAKDEYTRGHAERVARLSEMTAREYGVPKDMQRQVRYAALMHDIGKMVVESRVLKKPGKYTPEEYEHMKIHPIHGHAILSEIELLRGVVDGVRHHHERLDGSGYPDGLAGDDIPLSARLIMVADAFDSMTSTRSYRPPKTIDEAIAEIRRCAGTQFDLGALEALERAIASEGWQPAPETRPDPQQPLPHDGAHAGDVGPRHLGGESDAATL